MDAFLNESSFNTTVLSRQGSQSKFPPNVKVLRADYESHESLKTAFQGQDAVVSLVGGMALGDQNKLIDAAIAAGVKRFIPSEYGSDTPSSRVREIVPILEAKFATVNYLKSKEKEISWTSIIHGPFFEYCLKVGFFGFDISAKTVSLYDDGETTFSAASLHQVGVATVKVLEHADETKNQYVYFSGFQTTQKEILAAVEKVTGAKFTVNHVNVDDQIKQGHAALQKGDYSAIVALLQAVTFSKEKLGDLSPHGLWNDKLGIPKEGIEDTVRKVLG